LFKDSDRAFVAERAGAVVGFGFTRVVAGTRIVGPVVADDDAIALAAALGMASAEPVKLDLPPAERALHRWLTQDGRATIEERALMVRNAAALPGERGLVKVMASLAYG
jgi:hypothetical protein